MDEQINEFYGLSDANMTGYEDKNCAPVSWLAERLCPRNEVTWAAIKMRIK